MSALDNGEVNDGEEDETGGDDISDRDSEEEEDMGVSGIRGGFDPGEMSAVSSPSILTIRHLWMRYHLG